MPETPSIATSPTPEPNAPERMEPLLRWSAPQRFTPERGERWYLVGSIFVIGGAVYGILTGSWPFAIVIVLTGAMYFLLRGHSAPETQITIYPTGVLFEGQYMSWQDLKSYWFIATPHFTQLHIAAKDKRKDDIALHTGVVPVNDIRNVLNAFLPEESDKQEPLLDTILRICKL